MTWTARSFKAWLAEYSRDIGDVRAALDWALSPEGDPLLGLELAAEALPVMYELSLTEECRRRATMALATLPLVPSPDPRLEMQLSIMLGAALMYTPGPLSQTFRACERAIGVGLHMMGEQHAARTRLEGMLAKFVPRAVEYYTPGFQLDRGAVARVTLVRVLWVMGHEDLALPMLEQVVRDMRRVCSTSPPRCRRSKRKRSG